MSADNPYTSLPAKAFWKTGLAGGNVLEVKDLWTPKYPITTEGTVVTAGSCFAQHISRAMIKNGFSWVDSEPLPAYLSEAVGKKFGYGVFSFRTGNIYTTALLRQWVEAAFGNRTLEPELWEKDGRFYDPLRPAIEPGGFASAAECLALRENTLRAMRETLSTASLFVFTLGLTECWRNRHNGFVYAACPGTLAGEFNADDHEFYNQTYPEIWEDLNAVLDLIREYNPNMRFLLTVSPVPLTATASEGHVLPATIYSKSVLRAIAGDAATRRKDTDYFPSYEIISSFPYRGMFYMPNQREVARAGVDHVMTHFFAGLEKFAKENGLASPVQSGGTTVAPAALSDAAEVDDDIQCEEALLEAFAK